MALLPREDLFELESVVTRLDIGRTVLMREVDPRFVQSIPLEKAPRTQLMVDLAEMNKAVLADGSLPLVTWLENGWQYTEHRAEGHIFVRMLERLRGTAEIIFSSSSDEGCTWLDLGTCIPANAFVRTHVMASVPCYAALIVEAYSDAPSPKEVTIVNPEPVGARVEPHVSTPRWAPIPRGALTERETNVIRRWRIGALLRSSPAEISQAIRQYELSSGAPPSAVRGKAPAQRVVDVHRDGPADLPDGVLGPVCAVTLPVGSPIYWRTVELYP